ncbi:MAG: translation initiation factor IF-2 [Nitrospirales bacterium]|nr:translation initiation factor IF-2 [Nitrospirales bacterium]
MESRILIPELVQLGIEVTSHSNTLDEDSVRRALEVLQDKKITDMSEDSKKRLRKPSGKIGSGGKKDKVQADSGVEESKKTEKKHILIKKKKVEEPLLESSEAADVGEMSLLDAQDAETSLDAMSPANVPSEEEPAVLSPEVSTMDAHPVSTIMEDSAQEMTAESRDGVDDSQKSEAEVMSDKVPKKDASQSVADDPREEKIKKPKKVGRKRDDDLFAARYEDAARWQDLRPLPALRREERSRPSQSASVAEVTKPRKKGIKVQTGVSVKEFSELLGQRPAEIIRKLMDMGIALAMNQPMDLDAAALIAEGAGVNIEIVAEKQGEELLEAVLEEHVEKKLVSRAPVVTIMGHVDHGKTSLLDAIRQSHVTDREAGGITQHIGAYSVKVGDKRVTFLDTPGHEAFTAMRARGAQVTDIVVLVVSADDGVMPQTVEAIHHAQAADVPIVVAVNKIDKPEANPDRVKQGLSEHGLIPEAWGGQTIFVEVSAKEKRGLDQLLEMILLQAEILELKADIGCSARGVVLEARLDRGRGPVATVLVQHGKLKTSDIFVMGAVSGRVRALNSDTGAKIKEAGPSIPVEVIGLLSVPEAGDQVVVVKDERMARGIAEGRQQKQRSADLAATGPRRTLEELYAEVQEGEVKELAVLIKSDVQGSAGAIGDAVQKFTSDLVRFRVIHSGVGGISESDVLLAAASQALIIGFHVRPEPKAAALAEREGVDIRLHTVIYNVMAELKSAAEGLLAPTLKERVLGRAEVRQLFTVPKMGTIAGCYVTDGMIARTSAGIRVLRDHIQVYEGKLGSLRRFKDDAREVQQGYECGIGIENFNDVKIGDILEAFVFDEEAVKL